MIYLCEQLTIRCGCLNVLLLRGQGSQTPIADRRYFLWRGPGCNSASTTVIAHSGDVAVVIVINDGLVVYVMNDSCVDVRNGAVVGEPVPVPTSAIVTVAGIAEPVVYAAIKADVRSPVPGIKAVGAVTPAPISRGPKRADKWGQHPRARYPVIPSIG